MNILFNDFKQNYLNKKKEIDLAIQKVLISWWFILWEELKTFETNFAKKNNSKYCIWVWNGLDAIKISLMALWIQKWDEVITTSHTAIATTLAIIDVWATPVFVDIDETYNIDTKEIEKNITNKTKAILPVHIYWQPSDISTIQQICKKHNIRLIEDCCQAHFAKHNSINVWNFWDTGCFSFYPTKNLGAYWDAGAIVTNDEEIYKKCIKIRNYGQDKRYHHNTFGVNSRLDEIQAAILNVNLLSIDDMISRRNENAELYKRWLQEIKEIKLPIKQANNTHTFHLFVIEVEDRDNLIKKLQENGIPSLIHYPIPVHKQIATKPYIKTTKLPKLEQKVNKILSLPIHPFLSKMEIDHIILTIKKFYEK